jgi:microcystin-dependent protein
MTDPFVAEIRIMAFNFPPKGWAFCDGQLLPIQQNEALFSLLGTVYGGDGKSTFALPDLRGRSAIQPGAGAGLSQYTQGDVVGSETNTLFQSEIPAHSHQASASSQPAIQQAPSSTRALARSTPGFAYQSNTSANLVQLDAQAAQVAGAGFPHNNLPPYLVLNWCIALQGIFPQRP